MFPNHSVRFAYLLIPVLLLLGACGQNTPTAQNATPTQAVVATPDPRLATPVTALVDEPLQGTIAEIPNILIVPSRQSKAALATFFKTTPKQLDYVNPGLPDPVAPGTLVVIPPTYRVAGETLAEVAQQTGLSEALLRAANPRLAAGEELTTGMVLAVPALYIVPADTLLSSTADLLSTSQEALLSANPELANQSAVSAGTVLVVPPESEQR